MKSQTAQLPSKLPKDFASLNSIFPLRPINDDIDLANAYEIMDRLAVLDKRTKDQEDYLQTLILITEDHDRQDNQAAFAAADKVSGLDALRYLMQNHDMTQADLAKLLGVGPSAISMILTGTRPITADHARALARRFCVNPGLFL